MVLKMFKGIFNIDDVGNRWGVRFLYLFIVALNAAVEFNPYADKDFSWLISFVNELQKSQNSPEVLSTIPITQGNIIYSVTLLAAFFISLMASMLYSGLFIRSYRLKKFGTEGVGTTEGPIKASDLAKRFVLIVLFSIVASLPVMVFVTYFFVFGLVIFPIFFTVPASYLSGDNGLFKSFAYVFKNTKAYYLSNAGQLAIIFLAFLLTNYLAGYVAMASLTAYYIVNAAVDIWMLFAAGKYAGVAYIAMKEMSNIPDSD